MCAESLRTGPAAVVFKNTQERTCDKPIVCNTENRYYTALHVRGIEVPFGSVSLIL